MDKHFLELLLFRRKISLLPHLSISGTARSILDGDHGAEEEEDDRQVGETLLGETSEGCDDDPDVGAWR